MSGPDNLTRARKFLHGAGFGDLPAAQWVPLTGGVSSDLWKVDLGDRVICVKGALEKLRVDDDWHAPVSRNSVEFAWFTAAARTCPANVPRMLAHSAADGFFAMEFLDPGTHQVWKQQLMDGDVRPDVATQVGDVLGRLHRASSRDPDAPRAFATDKNFRQLRLEPYFLTTARRNPGVATILHELAARTAGTHLVVVHGDLSPKNILVGPDGPVLLDAECAWFGDPAFDLAFCLNHLVLKSVVRADRATELAQAQHVLVGAYLPYVSWEDQNQLLARTASLLPALLLARIDGSSPVEYIIAESIRAEVRATAGELLNRPAATLEQVLARLAGAWSSVISRQEQQMR